MESNLSKKDEMLQVIQKTPAQDIAEIQFVRDRFIENYNKSHRSTNGDMMYHRQVVHFKQLIASDENLRKADPFSLYACFITASVKGYSFDKEDDEVYLLALNGKAFLWRQAGAHVKRLIQSGQCKLVKQAKIVYKGDHFKVVNGVVIEHEERFETDEMLAGYVEFILRDGSSKFFIYRKNDWESWRKKSKQPNNENWNYEGKGQPMPGYLRTKLVKHACKEKTWAIGQTNVEVEEIPGTEIEDIEDVEIPNSSKQPNVSLPVSTTPTGSNNDFDKDDDDHKAVVVEDDDF